MTLLPLLGGMAVMVAPPKLVLSPAVNIVVDGNSITNDFQATGLDDLIRARLDTLGLRNGATITTGGGLGINGQTWRDATASNADLLAAWQPGKTNVLIAGETTNSILTFGATVAQTIADATAYLAAAAARSWIILLWGSIPGGRADEASMPGQAQRNRDMIAVDQHMASHYREMGAHGYISPRAGCPMFDHDGSDPARFAAYQAAWNEAPPWSTGQGGWVHPKDGDWPTASAPGTGKRAIAAGIATAVTDGTLPATP